MVADKASSSNPANNYLGGEKTSTRFYKDSTLTFQVHKNAHIKIDSIVFTATSEDYATALKDSVWTNATAVSNAKAVTVTPASGKGVFGQDISATIGATTGNTLVQVTYSAIPGIDLSSEEIEVMAGSSFNLTFAYMNFASEGIPSISASVTSGTVLEASAITQPGSNTTITVTAGANLGIVEFLLTATLNEQSATATLRVTVIAASRNLTSLAISTPSTDLVFGQGTPLTASALVLTASFDANPTSVTFSEITAQDTKGLTFSPALGSTLNTLGSNTITVSYTFTGPQDGAQTITKSVQYTVSVVEAITYTKVTSTPSDWRGTYLIVFESSETAGYAFDGDLETLDATNNCLPVTISENVIRGNSEAIDNATFEIGRDTENDGKYYLKSHSGFFIGNDSDSNGLSSSTDSKLVNAFSIAESELAITALGGCKLRFNSASNQLRFRFYATGQNQVSLYKKNISSSVESEIQSFGSAFLSSVTCSGQGSITSDGWASAKTAWDALSNDAQGYIANLNGDDSGLGIAGAVGRYDYIIKKYGVGDHPDFMYRIDAKKLSLGANISAAFSMSNSQNSGMTALFIIAFASIAVVTGGLFFALRRRKER